MTYGTLAGQWPRKVLSAKNPKDAADGLKEALSDIVTVTGAVVASATSSPNVTQTDNVFIPPHIKLRTGMVKLLHKKSTPKLAK